jgi:hypothetical protein
VLSPQPPLLPETVAKTVPDDVANDATTISPKPKNTILVPLNMRLLLPSTGWVLPIPAR